MFLFFLEVKNALLYLVEPEIGCTFLILVELKFSSWCRFSECKKTSFKPQNALINWQIHMSLTKLVSLYDILTTCFHLSVCDLICFYLSYFIPLIISFVLIWCNSDVEDKYGVRMHRWRRKKRDTAVKPCYM